MVHILHLFSWVLNHTLLLYGKKVLCNSSNSEIYEPSQNICMCVCVCVCVCSDTAANSDCILLNGMITE